MILEDCREYHWSGSGCVVTLLHVYHYNESFHQISFSLTGVNNQSPNHPPHLYSCYPLQGSYLYIYLFISNPEQFDPSQVYTIISVNY
jgi:hypothetical protein